MIATLGGKPQVVTFALDAFQRLGMDIERVVVMHLAPSDARVQHSLDALASEFVTHAAYKGRIRFDAVTIRERPGGSNLPSGIATSGRAITHIEDMAAPDAIWLTTHRLITTLKSEGYRIELCVSGGPRLIGFQAISAASLLFAMHDRCWHLFTPPDLRARAGEGEILHAVEADPPIRLIAVPLLPMGMIAPNLQAAASATPEEIIGERTRALSVQELRRCEDVIRQLTPRQRQVLREFAQNGAEVRSVADKLHITEATLNSHKTRIFDECRIAWGLPEDERLTHHFLREAFGDLSGEVWARWL